MHLYDYNAFLNYINLLIVALNYFEGLADILAFLTLMGASLLGIVFFIMKGAIKSEAGKIQKPYSVYLYASIILFIIGLTGVCTTNLFDPETQKSLDNGGAQGIIIVSVLLSLLVCIRAWWKARKIKQEENATNENL